MKYRQKYINMPIVTWAFVHLSVFLDKLIKCYITLNIHTNFTIFNLIL